MNEYAVAIITGLIVTGISAAAMWLLIWHFKKEKAKWEQIADDSYARGKDEASETIRMTCDQIEEDKAKLAELSDRDLLIQIMLALGSYGRRLDRMDVKLKSITNYKAYIDDMNAQTHNLSQSFVVLQKNITTTSSVIHGLRQTVQGTSQNIHQLITDLGDLNNLHIKIRNHISALSVVEQTLGHLQNSIADIIAEMNEVITTYDQAPMKKLKAIENKIATLLTSAEAIYGAVSNISDTTEHIKGTIDDSMEEYAYGSLYNRIGDIASKLNDLDYEIRNARSDIDSVKYTVNRTLSDSSYDSIYSKLNDIESGISSIRYKIGS